jgi:RNase H-fold protein (predicted Holliday junction resolvase)
MEGVEKLVKEKDVGAVVIGESRDFSGTDNPIMAKARVFAAELAKETGLPVHFEPEFMTSVEALRFQGGGEATHASASALILKSFLDRMNSSR